jgi:hypothetical protein
MKYDGKIQPWSEEAFADTVPLTPDAYRATHEGDLNDVRSAAGIAPKKIHEPTAESRSLQSLAGIR